MATDQEDDPSSPIEQLKGIFDLCDRDHDGIISVEEFRSLGQQHLGAVTQRIDQLINEIDPDNSGIITFENFKRGIQTYLQARIDSRGSSRSGSLSRGSFDEFLTSSPADDDNTFTVEDVHHDSSSLTRTSLSSTLLPLSYLSLGFTEETSPIHIEREPSVIELVTTNGTDAYPMEHEPGLNSVSFSGLEIQPSNKSPTLLARSLIKRNTHSLLHISSGGTNSSYSVTPEWKTEEDTDELTDKLQELSSRLEGLELDLDSSQTEKLKLKRENKTLKERLDAFEDTLRDVQWEKEEDVRQLKEDYKISMSKVKQEYSHQLEELQDQYVMLEQSKISLLHQEQEKSELLEGTVSILRHQLTEKDEECLTKASQSAGLQYHVSELEEELMRTREQLRLEREKWKTEKEDDHQEIQAMSHVIEHLRKELEDSKFTKKRNSINTGDLRQGEIMLLKKEIKTLKEERDRLSAQLLRQGQLLVNEQPRSLADELQDAPRADVMKALKEQEDLNARLKAYIEGLLVTILNTHPELLEIKTR